MTGDEAITSNADLAERAPPSPGKPAAVLRALRPVHWVKNLLVIVPLVLAHQLSNRQKLFDVLLAVAAFCLGASAVYVLNDLIDREADRHHPRKRTRPFASSQLSAATGVVMIVSLLAGAAGLAALTQRPRLMWMLGLYLALTTAYSLYLKSKLLVDVVLLAGLYTLRIIAGSVAADVVLTPWLLAFSMFLFLSLAFAKRYSELMQVEAGEQERMRGRGYVVDDLRIIESVGPTCGYLAVMVIALYIDSDIVKKQKLYAEPRALWLLCPVFLYWVTRLWFLARRRRLVDDPLVFALTDRVSWGCGILAAVIVTAASVRWR
jgi:4-hydroxybenzoate polyprenyltransferase